MPVLYADRKDYGLLLYPRCRICWEAACQMVTDLYGDDCVDWMDWAAGKGRG